MKKKIFNILSCVISLICLILLFMPNFFVKEQKLTDRVLYHPINYGTNSFNLHSWDLMSAISYFLVGLFIASIICFVISLFKRNKIVSGISLLLIFAIVALNIVGFNKIVFNLSGTVVGDTKIDVDGTEKLVSVVDYYRSGTGSNAYIVLSFFQFIICAIAIGFNFQKDNNEQAVENNKTAEAVQAI